ncbi:hypothetical protein FRC96_09380 [Lujinxingia vulgaris]|uniref:Uncharacterized protein n=1 Tax=Lujinxingia vulgaris TaxID=2600176 RepID=A0A5C6XAL6_9DELT|nr:hypothetical protein [Lujinxingia vulgaris]TXD36285.1 hypothetical protein FRC96_09380 [Lujinxingia vulgaris]
MLFRPSSPGSVRHALWLVALLAAASLTAACGEVELSRGTIDGQTAPGQSSPDDDAGPGDSPDVGAPGDTGNLEPDDDGVVMVPWSHEISNELLAQATLAEGSISFPLEGNDLLLDVAIADIIYNFDSVDPEPFIYRVEAIENTPEIITFFVTDAPLTDLIINAKINVDGSSNDASDTASRSQGLQPESGAIGQRRQRIDEDQFEPIQTTVSFPTVEARVCDNHSGVSVEVDLSADAIEGTLGSVEPGIGIGVGEECPSNTIGGRMKATPTLTIDIYDVDAALDIDTSWFGEDSNINENRCECFANNYPNYSVCGIPASMEDEYKRGCNGRLKEFRFLVNASFVTALTDLLLELYYEFEFEKTLFEVNLVKIPFALGPVPVTANVDFLIKFTATTDGGLSASWEGKNAPGFQMDTMFGIEYVGSDFREIEQEPLSEPYVIDDPDLLGQVNASLKLSSDIKFSGLILNFAGVNATLPSVYAKLEAGFERNFSTGESECTLELSIGAAVKVGLEADAGWLGDLIGINTSVDWTLFDTCDEPEGSFLRNLCFYRDFSESLDFLCPEPMPARINRVRLRVDDPEYPPGQNAPGSVPVDALFVQRVPVSSAPYYIAPTRITVDGVESAEALEMINEIQYLACDPELWEEKVILFDDEVVVDYADPFEAGDLIRVHRQGFNPGDAASNPTNPDDQGKLCVPNGSFHIDVGRSDKEQWENLILNVHNSSDHRITENFLELFAEDDAGSVGN